MARLLAAGDLSLARGDQNQAFLHYLLALRAMVAGSQPATGILHAPEPNERTSPPPTELRLPHPWRDESLTHPGPR